MRYLSKIRTESIRSHNRRDRTWEIAGIPLWVVLVCSAALALFVAEVTLTLQYPWFASNEIWQGLQIPAAARILEGAVLYPDIYSEASFYGYPPMLPWIHALFLSVFGIGIFAVKISAVLACGLTLVGIYYLSTLLTHNRVAGLLAVAFYTSFFEALQFWHISVRPDNMGSCFVLWATIIGYRYKDSARIWPSLAAGGLLAAAALCKQPFVVVGLSFFGYLFWTGRTRFGTRGALVWVLSGLLFLLAYDTGGERFWDIIIIASQHPLKSPWEIISTSNWILALLLVPASIVIVNFRGLGLLSWQVVGAIAMGILGLSKVGGDVNGFLTAVVLLSPLMVSGLGRNQENAQLKRLLPVLVGLTVVVSSVHSIDRVVNWKSRHLDNITPVARFIEQNKDKKVYYPIKNYLTYVTSGQYYHCDLQSETLVWAGLPVPEAVLKTVAEKYFDYILGDFKSPELKSYVNYYYKRAYPPELQSISVWVPK